MLYILKQIFLNSSTIKFFSIFVFELLIPLGDILRQAPAFAEASAGTQDEREDHS